MSNFLAAVHGRLQLRKGDKIAGVFSVPVADQTYVILCEFQKNKWKEFWSTKATTENLSGSVYSEIMVALGDNLGRLFSGQNATSNVNDEVQEIVAGL